MTDLATIPDLLFYTYDLQKVIENQERALANEVNAMNENEVLNTSQEDIVKYLVEKYRMDPPNIDESGIQIDYDDAQVDVSRDFRRVVFDRNEPFYVTGTCVTFFVPFSGDPDLFKCKRSTFSLNPPKAAVRTNELIFTYYLIDEQAATINNRFKQDLENTQGHTKCIATDIGRFNLALPENASKQLKARRKKLLQDRNLVAKIDFPLRQRQNPPPTFVVPNVKRRITPQKPAASSKPFRPEPALGMDEYEHILSVLSNMVAVMERSPRAFKNMDEEDLRTHFLVQLNGQYEGQATGETFNYEGRTDILIRVNDRNIFIAECKFWTGPAGLTKALDQLLGYTAWRDTKTALLVFNRNKKMAMVLEKVTETVRDHPNYKAEQTSSETKFRYVFGHRDDANREITVAILVFDIPAVTS